jgi:hypothetical protein
VTESEFQALVLDMANLFGWRSYHTHDSRRSAAGFPDLVLVRRERLIFAELKTERGRVGDAQSEWLDALDAIPGIEVYLWRPSDTGRIEHVLRYGPDERPRLRSTDTMRRQSVDGAS